MIRKSTSVIAALKDVSFPITSLGKAVSPARIHPLCMAFKNFNKIAFNSVRIWKPFRHVRAVNLVWLLANGQSLEEPNRKEENRVPLQCVYHKKWQICATFCLNWAMQSGKRSLHPGAFFRTQAAEFPANWAHRNSYASWAREAGDLICTAADFASN